MSVPNLSGFPRYVLMEMINLRIPRCLLDAIVVGGNCQAFRFVSNPDEKIKAHYVNTVSESGEKSK